MTKTEPHWLDAPEVQPAAVRMRAWRWFKGDPGTFDTMHRVAETIEALQERRRSESGREELL